MCQCCSANHASLWSVTPTSTRSGCGCCSQGISTTTNGFGCLGRCSSAQTAYAGGYTQSSAAYVVRQVNGCSNCPYARTCSYGCGGCASAWYGNN